MMAAGFAYYSRSQSGLLPCVGSLHSLEKASKLFHSAFHLLSNKCNADRSFTSNPTLIKKKRVWRPSSFFHDGGRIRLLQSFASGSLPCVGSLHSLEKAFKLFHSAFHLLSSKCNADRSFTSNPTLIKKKRV